jgi:hypothetical protein
MAFRTLAAQKGPCITFAIPDYHPGAPEGTQRATFKRLLQQADPSPLLAALEELAETAAFDAGGQGWAIFRAPGFLAHYRAPVRVAQCSNADRFLLAPFVADALAPEEFLVLALNTKRLRLFEYADGKCAEITWPEDLPSSVEAAAGRSDRPDHDLQNRSSAGIAGGHGGTVHFGTGTGRETSDAHLHDFFEAVDRGLKKLAAQRPLVLIGVQQETAAYLAAARDRAALLAAEPGNADALTPTEIGTRAYAAVLRNHAKAGDAVLAKIREMRDRSRVATDMQSVIAAAEQGRVHQLCVRGAGLTNTESLVNLAVVETLRSGGDVFVLPEDRLTAEHPLAAILRY